MADVKYEFYDTAGSQFGYEVASDEIDIGQTILTTSAHNVQFVKVYIAKTGAGTGTLNMGWYATAGGFPTGSALGTGTLDISTLTGVEAWTRIDFDTAFAVANATTYALVFFGSGIPAGSTCRFAVRAFGALYSGGEAIERAVAGVDPWQNIAPGQADNWFEVWDGDPPTPPEPTEVDLTPFTATKRAVLIKDKTVFYEDV
jgi:hypothetical protein